MKKPTLKYISLFIFTFLFAYLSKAQTYKQLVKFADENYNAGDYYGASIYYRKAMDIDSLDIHLLWKYAECLRLYNEYGLAEYYYKEIYSREGAKIYPLSAFWWATMQKYNGKYRDAIKTFKTCTRLYGKDKKSFEYLKSKQEINSCNFALRMSKDTTGFIIKNLGEPVNSFDSEFGAFLKDSVLYFSSLRAQQMNDALQVKDKFYKIKIYKSLVSNNRHSRVENADTLYNSALFHNANGIFSPDGERFYFTRCDATYNCKLMVSFYKNGNWQQPREIEGGVNKDGYTSTQPSLAIINNEEYLFFASNMPGGQGKMDIWYSLVKNGTHTKPVNAGKNINSIDDEVTPFYDIFSGALFFSSAWHEGYGGFDIFKSDGIPGKFSAPVNMGFPVNTSWNDLYYTVYPDKYKAYLTSNRKGSLFKKGPTCCNDIYEINFPKEEIPADTIPYQSLEDLNKYLPVTLYFHNDEPNPRSTDTLTKLNYITTYNAYTALTDKYKEEYSKGLSPEKADKAKEDIENFFTDYVDKGVADLEIFTKLLLKELEKGQKIEMTIKGFASPLAKTDYNVQLTKRRISSFINYLNEYEGGVFKPYINGTAENGGLLLFDKIPYGEYTASQIVSDNFHDQKNSVYSRSAALERKIEIQSVQRAVKDSLIGELRLNKEVHDFGYVKQGETLKYTFALKNTGKDKLKFENMILSCDCVKANLDKKEIEPGESVGLTLVFNTNGLSGKQVKTVTLITDGFPPNKKITLTAEIKP
jgi:hypothetical protein